ncbi:MAG: archease [Candidatus Pacebacteria bacterium]|nr:archease [Candidatus Paceibacterota bacterium]
MPYEFLDNIATADVAFRAWGTTREALIEAAVDALLNATVTELDSVQSALIREITVEADTLEMVVHNFLEELVYLKDAEHLLLRVREASVQDTDEGVQCRAVLRGERIDVTRHDLVADVKAVTFHGFEVCQTSRGWEATVVLDV